jgi:hypothetical protein
MPGLVLIAAAALAVYLALRLFAATDPRRLARGLRWAVAAAGVLLAVYLMAVGQLGTIVMLVAMAGPFLLTSRWGAPFRAWFGGDSAIPSDHGPSRSAVETAHLRMTLDHATGAMAGEVLDGPGRGRGLADLTPAELMALRAHLAGRDAASLTLLETWLDRTHSEWRRFGEGPRGATAPETGEMTREEACAVLGLASDPSVDAVRAAHRRLMRRFHPDVGGSDYLAAKINRAKDILLRG